MVRLTGLNYTRVQCVGGLLVNCMEHTFFAFLTRRCSGQGPQNSSNFLSNDRAFSYATKLTKSGDAIGIHQVSPLCLLDRHFKSKHHIQKTMRANLSHATLLILAGREEWFVQHVTRTYPNHHAFYNIHDVIAHHSHFYYILLKYMKVDQSIGNSTNMHITS